MHSENYFLSIKKIGYNSSTELHGKLICITGLKAVERK